MSDPVTIKVKISGSRCRQIGDNVTPSVTGLNALLFAIVCGLYTRKIILRRRPFAPADSKQTYKPFSPTEKTSLHQ
ncbi:MAG: hypothetical protein ACK4IY_10180 [Chitinophagales bacterium]